MGLKSWLFGNFHKFSILFSICVMTQIGYLQTSQELIIDPFAKSSFLFIGFTLFLGHNRVSQSSEAKILMSSDERQ